MIIEMLTGGGLVIIGGACGFTFGRITRRKSPKPPKAICGCTHELAFHDPSTGECHSVNTVNKYRNGYFIGEEQVRCTCRQYDGPTPLPTVYAREILE